MQALKHAARHASRFKWLRIGLTLFDALNWRIF
jgi:hypothetical protein